MQMQLDEYADKRKDTHATMRPTWKKTYDERLVAGLVTQMLRNPRASGFWRFSITRLHGRSSVVRPGGRVADVPHAQA